MRLIHHTRTERRVLREPRVIFGPPGGGRLPLAQFCWPHKYSFRLMMKRLLVICFLFLVALGAQGAAPPTSGEYIILVGGPSMYQWEKYKAVPHDHWWANFIRAARLRTEQLRGELGPD